MTDRQAPRTPRRGPSSGLYLVLAAVIMGLALLVVWGVSRQTRTDPTGATGAVPSSTSSTPPPTSAPTSATTAPGAGALTTDALLTADDLAGIGLEVGAAVPRDEPVLPALCGAGSWSETWSAPLQGVGQDLPGPGATVTEHVVGYADEATTVAAFDRLVQDAADCPAPDTGGSVTVTAVDVGLGDDSAVFLVDDGGRDGSVLTTWAVAVRHGDRLLMTGYTTQEEIGTGSGPGAGGDDSGGAGPQAESTARSIAEVALTRLEAFVPQQD
jgi:hypothetical protein